MTRCNSLFVTLTLTGVVSALSLPGLADPPTKTILPPTSIPSTPAQKAALIQEANRLPLAFESNQGQTDAHVRFLTRSSDSTLFLTPSEAVFSLPAPLSAKTRQKTTARQDRAPRSAKEKIAAVSLRMQMVGADPKAKELTQQPLPGKINYFLGKDPSRWHAGVPTFGRVGFQGVYPGVDMVYYGNRKHLEYDFLVAPHADPQQIALHFAGAQAVRVNQAGDLFVRTQGRELHWQKPAVYQQDATGKHSIPARFRLKRLPNGQSSVSFALGHYDTARPLVIDPVLLYSTYLAGTTEASPSTGGTTGDTPNSIAIDSSGNAYVTGRTYASDFPTTSGVFQTVNNGYSAGNITAFVTKINSTGTSLVYSTYLGGSNNDSGTAIAVDSGGNAYIAGYTYSNDFPTTTGAFQTVNNAYAALDATCFVTKLNSTGTALLYSTYLGGSNYDFAKGIAVDSSGNAYVTGAASSTNFPTTSGVYQTTNHGVGSVNFTGFVCNGFVTKLNSTATALTYSTYLGGSISDNINAIAIDSSGNAYVTGKAASNDFPTTTGAFQTVNHAYANFSFNGFVTKLNSTATALTYSTYLGGSMTEVAYSIAIDSSGNAYVAGLAFSSDFPTTSGVFQTTKPTTIIPRTSYGSGFVTKFNSTGTALLYSTYLGGSGGDGAYGIALDSSGNTYITGSAGSTDFPTTTGAFQRVNNAGTFGSSFVTKLNSTATALLYSTFLGGTGSTTNTEGLSIAIDSSGRAFITGDTTGVDYPTTSGAFQGSRSGGTSRTYGFVTKLAPIPIFPDFNNDGNVDLLLQTTSTNAIESWFMQGASKLGGASFSSTPTSGYALVGSGDFSGDGTTDLVFQNSSTNVVVLWYTSGTNHATISGGNTVSSTPASGYKVVGIGDFNSDGKSDLLFQNSSTGALVVWYMNGYTQTAGVTLSSTPASGDNVVGVGDFNGDGFTDIVFQNSSTNAITIWYMKGTTFVSSTTLTTVPAAGYKVVAVGDYDGDGSADLIFSNASNVSVVWYIAGGVYVGGSSLSTNPASGTKIVGPR
ncbi:MAG: hypothetical protein JWL77_5666 [Chthonomonadaceae bacterium]|nr:hypothetical protein [Chthonomonadaceae bacterium]